MIVSDICISYLARGLDRSEDVGLTHDEVLLTFVLDLGASVLAIEDDVAKP